MSDETINVPQGSIILPKYVPISVIVSLVMGVIGVAFAYKNLDMRIRITENSLKSLERYTEATHANAVSMQNLQNKTILENIKKIEKSIEKLR